MDDERFHELLPEINVSLARHNHQPGPRYAQPEAVGLANAGQPLNSATRN